LGAEPARFVHEPDQRLVDGARAEGEPAGEVDREQQPPQRQVRVRVLGHHLVDLDQRARTGAVPVVLRPPQRVPVDAARPLVHQHPPLGRAAAVRGRIAEHVPPPALVPGDQPTEAHSGSYTRPARLPRPAADASLPAPAAAPQPQLGGVALDRASAARL
jgi:hypothetical protein